MAVDVGESEASGICPNAVQLPKSWTLASPFPRKKKKIKHSEEIGVRREEGAWAGNRAEKARGRAERGGDSARQHFTRPACLTQATVFLVILQLPSLGLRRHW